jgi:hypothetical protein
MAAKHAFWSKPHQRYNCLILKGFRLGRLSPQAPRSLVWRRPAVAAGLSCLGLFVQLHNSLAGGKLRKARWTKCCFRLLPLVPDPELVPDPTPDVDPRLEPKPPMFGLVGTLQNVAVISCWQTTPVSGKGELFVWPPVPSACCRDCAATGDVAKSSAVISVSFFHLFILRSGLRGKARAFKPPNVRLNIWLHSPARPAMLRLLISRATVRAAY